MKKAIVPLLSTIICIGAFSVDALACSCGPPPGISKAYLDADAVFLAKVKSVDTSNEYVIRSNLLVIQS